MTPEGCVKAACVDVLKQAGAWYCFPATAGYGRSGVPDILGCLNGFFFAIECKAEGGRATALQVRELDLIQKAGGAAIVVKGLAEVAKVRPMLEETNQRRYE